MLRNVDLRLIASGLASPQIGQALSMEPAMVDVYCRNLVRKLHLNSMAELAEYGLSHGPIAA